MLLRMFAAALILAGLACTSASASWSFGRHGGRGGGAGKVFRVEALPKEGRTPHLPAGSNFR